jgi:glycosyltransferase involved in cell wall biosynthesis
LRAIGHQVDLVPLYLPLLLEDQQPKTRVRMGGINVWLQQQSRAFRLLPRWLADMLDSPGLLRWAAGRAGMTQARALGAMTLSMLQGEDGKQVRELDQLAQWAADSERPDVIVLSNALLCGTARRLKNAVDRPIVATLQGEAPFLDALPEPYAAQAWHELGVRAADIDAFVAVSATYGALMRERLALDAARVRVVHNGIEAAIWPASPRPLIERRPPAIGYVARMSRDKGLATLVEAFVRLKQRGRIPDPRLRAAGAVLAEDRALLRELRGRLAAAGLADAAEFLANVTRAQKQALLQEIAVLSVPAAYGESFGLYQLEAMVSGAPVVQPRHGAFPEIVEATGGGVLCEPDDPDSLAYALEGLLLDTGRAQRLADAGRRAVLERFTTERMANEFVAACRMLVKTA